MIIDSQAKTITLNTLGLPLSKLSFQEAIHAIIHAAKFDHTGFVCFANAHMTVEANWQPSFAQQLTHAKFIFPDGMPLVWASKVLHQGSTERIAGMDAFPKLLEAAAAESLPVYFYGSSQEVLEAICTRCRQCYPQLRIAGALSPPFTQRTEEAILHDIEQINQSGAKLVFVALGCPKQERWMAKYSPQIKAILLGVGGAFPVFAQVQKRAPLFWQKMGLEWLFRLIQEPKRLWKRYFMTNSVFIWLFLKNWFYKK